jgi:tetratricopeptide (TPR) repeat protein
MRYAAIALMLTCSFIPVQAQEKTEGPHDAKAQKTYNEGLEALKRDHALDALDKFKKADKQDGGHCLACQKKMIKYGNELGEWKTAELAGEEMVAQAQGEDLALAHYQFGTVLMNEAFSRHKDELFSRVHEEMTKALAAHDNFPSAVYLDGRALARMKQDDAAKAQFERFVKMRPEDDPDRQRACAISASRSWRGPEWRRRLW